MNFEDKLEEDQFLDVSIDGSSIEECNEAEEMSDLEEEEEADVEADSLGDNQSAGE